MDKEKIYSKLNHIIACLANEQGISVIVKTDGSNEILFKDDLNRPEVEFYKILEDVITIAHKQIGESSIK